MQCPLHARNVHPRLTATAAIEFNGELGGGRITESRQQCLELSAANRRRRPAASRTRCHFAVLVKAPYPALDGRFADRKLLSDDGIASLPRLVRANHSLSQLNRIHTCRRSDLDLTCNFGSLQPSTGVRQQISL